jgi:hypothetical protein
MDNTLFKIANRINIAPISTSYGSYWMVVDQTVKFRRITFHAYYNNNIDICYPIHICKYIDKLVDRSIQELLNLDLVVGTIIGPKRAIQEELENIVDAFADLQMNSSNLAFSEMLLVIDGTIGAINHAINPQNPAEHLLQVVIDEKIINKYKRFSTILCITLDRISNIYRNLIDIYGEKVLSTNMLDWNLQEMNNDKWLQFKSELKTRAGLKDINDIQIHEDCDGSHTVNAIFLKDNLGKIIPIISIIELKLPEGTSFFEMLVAGVETYCKSLFPQGEKNLEERLKKLKNPDINIDCRPFVNINDDRSKLQLAHIVTHELIHFISIRYKEK